MTNVEPNPIYQRNAPFAKPSTTNYETVLPGALEQQFRAWVRKNNVPFNPDDKTSDYDMRGYYMSQKLQFEGALGDVPAHLPGAHFPDTFKTPYHATFSDESQYATPNNPFHWRGDTLTDIRTGNPENPVDHPSSWYAPGADRSRTRPATPPTRIRPAADPTVPGIPGATSIPGPRAPDYPTPGRGVRPHYSPPGEGPQYPTPGIPGSHTQRPAMQTGNATRQDPVAGPAADHYERGFAEGRSAAPKFRENLLNLIDAHLMASLMEELGGHGIT
jgi:hypothetical protein